MQSLGRCQVRLCMSTLHIVLFNVQCDAVPRLPVCANWTWSWYLLLIKTRAPGELCPVELNICYVQFFINVELTPTTAE